MLCATGDGETGETGDTWGDRGHMGDRGDIEGRGLRGADWANTG